jgi:hypothetical protein
MLVSLEGEGNPFGRDRVWAVHHVEVQVRFGGISGIAKEAEYLARFDVVPQLYPEASGLEMGIKSEAAGSHFQDDIISGKRLRGDGNGSGAQSRDVLDDAIFDGDNFSRGDSEEFRTVGVIAFVPVSLSPEADPVFPEL